MANKVQTFNDGVVYIYRVVNSADAGNMPVEKLELTETLRYKERTVGMNRYYTALQANAEIKYVLRCQMRRTVSPLDIAIPNDGKQYRIVMVQYPEDVEPPVMDLTLAELEQEYENTGG